MDGLPEELVVRIPSALGCVHTIMAFCSTSRTNAALRLAMIDALNGQLGARGIDPDVLAASGVRKQIELMTMACRPRNHPRVSVHISFRNGHTTGDGGHPEGFPIECSTRTEGVRLVRSVNLPEVLLEHLHGPLSRHVTALQLAAPKPVQMMGLYLHKLLNGSIVSNGNRWCLFTQLQQAGVVAMHRGQQLDTLEHVRHFSTLHVTLHAGVMRHEYGMFTAWLPQEEARRSRQALIDEAERSRRRAAERQKREREEERLRVLQQRGVRASTRASRQ